MIVLDTHALLWWVNGDGKLSTAAAQAIEQECTDEQGLILVSSISAWEIAVLVAKGRLTLSTDIDDWLATVEELESVRFVPVDNDLAVQSTRLPEPFHPDPADRMIVALARHLSAPLVTADARIQAYRHVKTIW
ncbi:VapC toxin family PIN domain ribonuclease [Thioalkalivibrio denitrificans]|uniref:VapC toxin family PIN domain ribonuclease n=1 Tax=Thioalkalivibrio denitrificans TaxID=108003 RepID=A0A1V3N6W2_9GAMM|nr:type II toxin-antitoxin system VapC family toxin [Thioalkalivibrio denitrificans]OOG20526.1 VapC toxin family PIN domain ribonuclease [Thioalkalivibrio denitrificans]